MAVERRGSLNYDGQWLVRDSQARYVFEAIYQCCFESSV